MTLPTELLGLLNAIAASPEEDLPRLMLADWLEGVDPPQLERAEFVRVQIELARLTQPNVADAVKGRRPAEAVAAHSAALMKFVSRRGELSRREHDLWVEFGQVWLAHNHWLAVLDTVGRSDERLLWHRGFPAKVRLSWELCSLHLDSILSDQWVPGLDEVELTTWPRLEYETTGTLRGPYRFAGEVVTLKEPGSVADLLPLRWPRSLVRSWTLPERREPARCPVCDWPMAERMEDGCVPGNCSYRPDPDSAEGHRIRRRREELAEARDER